MRYQNTVHGKFINRPNRFIAQVEIEGEVHTVHVKNTGRCKELLLPGVEVVLEESHNPERKTRFDLVSVYKENLGWVNIDSMAPNIVVGEWLNGENKIFGKETKIKPEYKFGDSRIDFYVETPNRKALIEVKGVTLEQNGTGLFPDAPTERGVKHLRELTGAVSMGYECYIAFVIAMPGINRVYPNIKTHPEFGETLEQARTAGVKVLHLSTEVFSDSLQITSVLID